MKEKNAEYYRKKGEELLKKGKIKKSEKYFKIALDKVQEEAQKSNEKLQNVSEQFRFSENKTDLPKPPAKDELDEKDLNFNKGNEYYKIGDYENAAKHFKIAADLGDPRCQYNLGVFYLNGYGVDQDYEIGLKYYRLAADGGFERARYYLGTFYDDGEIVAQDYKEAVKYYKLGAEQGSVLSQYRLGLCYENGKGVPKDLEKAVEYYRRAARIVPEAQEALKRLGY